MCAQYLFPVNYLLPRLPIPRENVSIENVIVRCDSSGGGDILESRVYFYFFEKTLVELFLVEYKIVISFDPKNVSVSRCNDEVSIHEISVDET